MLLKGRCELVQGIDMCGEMRSLPDGSRPYPEDDVRAEFKYEWEVPLAGSGLKTTFNHELVNLDFIFCWTFRFPGQRFTSDNAAASDMHLQQLISRSEHADRIIDHMGCTGRICTSYHNRQGVQVEIPDKLKGSAFLINNIHNSNGVDMKSPRRMTHSFIRVVSVKALIEATFDHQPDSSIAWTPSQPASSQSSAFSSASNSRHRPASAACLPDPTHQPRLPGLMQPQAGWRCRPPSVKHLFRSRLCSARQRRPALPTLLRAAVLQPHLNAHGLV